MNSIESKDDFRARIYPLSDYFAVLATAGQCQAVEVGHDFWERCVSRLAPGRLVSLIESVENWKGWECHPEGEEFILQLTGSLELILDFGDRKKNLTLIPMHFSIVPRGVWHTANVIVPGSALYITQGKDTENRARD